MVLQTGVMNYGGNGKTVSIPPNPQAAAPKPEAGHTGCACKCNGKKAAQPEPKAALSVNGLPDFSKMTAAQKVAHHRAKWDRILG